MAGIVSFLKRGVSGVLRGVRNRLQSTGLAQWGPLRKLYNALIGNLKDTTPGAVFPVLGHQMYLDKHDNLNLSVVGRHEKLITELVQAEIRPGDIVVDIGANIGYYTLLFARSVGPSGHVYAFEPDPENFALLQKNIVLNGYTNVTLEQKAVSDRTDTLRLYLADNVGDHRAYDSGDHRSCIEIPAVALDSYFGAQKIDFIKMDIQGFEHTVLRGMQRILSENTAVKLISEFWPFGLHLAGSTARAYLDQLYSLGFRLTLLDGNQKLPDCAIAEIETRYDATKDEWSGDVFCQR